MRPDDPNSDVPDDADPNNYVIDTDRGRLDLGLVHEWLSTDAFWAIGRSREVVETAAANSINFGVYLGAAQVGYSRVVTDGVTFGWLCDVYIAREHRGRGLGVRLANAVTTHVAPMGLTRFVLSTLDAHGVYAKVGFVPYPTPERLMLLTPPATD
jgi:GNAT superfamily N-acetyltransferase